MDTFVKKNIKHEILCVNIIFKEKVNLKPSVTFFRASPDMVQKEHLHRYIFELLNFDIFVLHWVERPSSNLEGYVTETFFLRVLQIIGNGSWDGDTKMIVSFLQFCLSLSQKRFQQPRPRHWFSFLLAWRCIITLVIIIAR